MMLCVRGTLSNRFERCVLQAQEWFGDLPRCGRLRGCESLRCRSREYSLLQVWGEYLHLAHVSSGAGH